MEWTFASLRDFKDELQQFCGTEMYFLHRLEPTVVCTEGVEHLARRAKAYWLIDAIAAHFDTNLMREAMEQDERLKTFQVWSLELIYNTGLQGMLLGRADSNVRPFVEQHLDTHEFPLGFIEIWAAWDGSRWVLYLPNEH